MGRRREAEYRPLETNADVTLCLGLAGPPSLAQHMFLFYSQNQALLPNPRAVHGTRTHGDTHARTHTPLFRNGA